ncbi:MAG: MBL fold metallo-hydrolase [Candidatus Dadabacteria bacterium]|nr:MAG: MBL fold metallo-hydrolase [Candidatus Dadabacteria bacterium]
MFPRASSDKGGIAVTSSIRPVQASGDRQVQLQRTQIGPLERLELRVRHGNHPTVAIANIYRLGRTLFDAGFFYAEQALLQALESDWPERVLLTHHHEDHVASLAALRDRNPDLEIWAPAELAPLVERGWPDPGPVRGHFWGPAAPVSAVSGYAPDAVFREGDVTITAIPTPGHCPYHCGFIIDHQQGRFVLTGDLYYRRKPLSIWYEASAPDAIASLRRVAALGEDVTILPYHLDPINGPDAFLQQADWIEREAEKVLKAAEQLGSRDPARIAEHLYGPPDVFERATGGEINKAAFVRSVLDPVRDLPATPIPV